MGTVTIGQRKPRGAVIATPPNANTLAGVKAIYEKAYNEIIGRLDESTIWRSVETALERLEHDIAISVLKEMGITPPRYQGEAYELGYGGQGKLRSAIRALADEKMDAIVQKILTEPIEISPQAASAIRSAYRSALVEELKEKAAAQAREDAAEILKDLRLAVRPE